MCNLTALNLSLCLSHRVTQSQACSSFTGWSPPSRWSWPTVRSWRSSTGAVWWSTKPIGWRTGTANCWRDSNSWTWSVCVWGWWWWYSTCRNWLIFVQYNVVFSSGCYFMFWLSLWDENYFFYEWKRQCNVLNLPYPLKPAHSQYLFLLICVNVVVSPVQF